jgi:hypothetical protein
MGVEVVISFEVNTVCGARTEVAPLGFRRHSSSSMGARF